MKISDKGLHQILSLGLLKPTDIAGVFYLYTWKNVNYYCGLPLSKNNFNKEGVFIKLSSEQFRSLPTKTNKASTNESLISVSNYLETAVHLSYNKETNSLMTKDFSGINDKIKALQISLNSPSPFLIVKETLKSFHGFYHPIKSFDQQLTNAYIKHERLWISASPIVKNNEFEGVIAGFTNGRDYGLDVLEVINDCASKVA